MATIIRQSRVLLVGTALVGTALVAVGCSAPGRPGPGPVVRHVSHQIAGRLAASVPCKTTTALPHKPLPAEFRPVAVVRCYPKARGIDGRGLWRYMIKQQADHHLAAFIAALRRASVQTPAGEACLTMAYLDPPFALVDGHGRIVRPTLPARDCGQPYHAAITDLEHLPWVTISVRRTVQLATRAELRTGCNPQWEDLIRTEGASGLTPPSAGGPAFSPRPPQLRVCIYRDGTRAFIRGGIMGQTPESKLLGEIQAGRTSTLCRHMHTTFAVLEAVSPAHRGGQIAVAELGGCHRILRPDNEIGAISSAGLAILRAVGRSSS